MLQTSLDFTVPPPAAQAEAAKQKALDRVAAANATWIADAVDVIRKVASAGNPFTSDDVWPDCGYCAEPRAMGAAFRVAQKLGLVVPTTEWRLSSRAACHRRPLRVWRAA